MEKLIAKSFTFEAAHKLENAYKIENKNIHGHSFHVTIFIKGEINDNGMILDFSHLEERITVLKEILDHSYLNDIDGIALPTLENIGLWIYNRLKFDLNNLHKIMIERRTCGERFEVYL